MAWGQRGLTGLLAKLRRMHGGSKTCLLPAPFPPQASYTAPACSSSLTQAASPHLELTVWSGAGQ